MSLRPFSGEHSIPNVNLLTQETSVGNQISNAKGFIPFFVLLSFAEHLEGCRIKVRVPPTTGTPSSSELASTSEEPASAVSSSQGSGGVHQLEGAFVLLVVVGVLGSTGADLTGVLVHVTTIRIG
jgi:hypothetical protein